MNYNSNLLTILNWLLIGESPPEKKIDHKYLICKEVIFLFQWKQMNESFNDMFKRLLNKYNMIFCLIKEKCSRNYVYNNQKKTTLIRETEWFLCCLTK